jgi:hypothetical protein
MYKFYRQRNNFLFLYQALNVSTSMGQLQVLQVLRIQLPHCDVHIYICIHIVLKRDHVCGLVVRVPGYRSRDPEFDSRRYQIFWELVVWNGVHSASWALVSTIEELLGRNSSGSGLENREYGRGDPLLWPRDTLYSQKLALTSPTCGGRSVGIVRLLQPRRFFSF